MTTTNAALRDWVAETAKLTQPDRIHWCTGSDTERDELIELMLGSGDLIELNQATFPNCYLHRSNPSDVARVEHLTFICTQHKDDAGPNNNWMAPAEAHAKIDALFAGCMKGRTLYVVPYCMGPINSPYARCGVEITDSPYVVLNMRIMTRMGTPALHRIEKDGTFVKGLHSIGDLNPDRRFIMHFPDELSIKSIGSGYGGNALLGKKCHALRIASRQARTEGWLAEHMLIVGLENPRGEVHYVAGRIPVGLRQDQPRHADPARHHAGLEGVDHRRGHRVAARRQRRPAARDQPRGGLLRRGPGHQPEDQPQRLRDDPPRHDLHERRGDGRQRAVVGRPHHRHAGHRLAGSPVRQGERPRRACRTRASPCRPSRTRPTTT